MAHNPDATFIVSQVSRKDLAEVLNNLATECEDTPPDWVPLAPDDQRLTDELCQRYADGLYEIEGYESEREESESDLMQNLLEACGWHSVEPPAPQSAHRTINITIVMEVPAEKNQERLDQEVLELVNETVGAKWALIECRVV